jgi:hypothetical protein
MCRLFKRNLALFVLGPIFAVVACSAAAQIQVFSTGQYGTPETISLVPAGFGTLEGNYFIPDARTGDIWVVPTTGGPPSSFAVESDQAMVGGLFLPSSGWGDFSGQFLFAGFRVFAVDGGAVRTEFDPNMTGGLATLLIAPAGFPNYGGHLFVSDENKVVWQTAPALPGDTAHFQVFADKTSILGLQNAPFGLEFTPPEWPVSENRLLVSDGGISVDGGPFKRVSYIASLDPSGTGDGLFATIPLTDNPDGSIGQTGLRQMLMAPDGFFVPLGLSGQLLLVSVSGSDLGGGVLGELLALDQSGAVKAHLKVGSVLAKFDPRGMIFTSDGHLLISDTSDPIYEASALDFAPVRSDCGTSVISSVSTSTLWPPNHNLINIGLSASVTGTCAFTSQVLAFSDEDDQAETGDGNFSPDARNLAPGTLRLRAERNAKGDGRVYLVVVKATDSAKIAAVSCNTVVVPKDQSESAKSSVEAQAEAANAFCLANAGAAPAGYFAVGDGPVIGPKQ